MLKGSHNISWLQWRSSYDKEDKNINHLSISNTFYSSSYPLIANHAAIYYVSSYSKNRSVNNSSKQ